MDRTWQNICRSSNRLFFRRVCQAKPKSPAAKPKLVRPPSPLARSNSKGSKASNGSAPTPVTVKWVEVIWSTPCIACWQDSRDRKNAESLKFIHVCIRMAPQDLWSGNVNCCGFIFNYINYIYMYTHSESCMPIAFIVSFGFVTGSLKITTQLWWVLWISQTRELQQDTSRPGLTVKREMTRWWVLVSQLGENCRGWNEDGTIILYSMAGFKRHAWVLKKTASRTSQHALHKLSGERTVQRFLHPCFEGAILYWFCMFHPTKRHVS